MAIPATEGAVSGLSWPLRTGCVKSAQSGREGLLAMKQRGFTRPAKLAVGDGVLGGAVGSVSIHPHAALLDAQDWGSLFQYEGEPEGREVEGAVGGVGKWVNGRGMLKGTKDLHKP